jgi:hypothetical protein
MISNYEKEIINRLIDKYEKSKSFNGDNKVNQRFTIKISSLFPKYNDHSEYELFEAINDSIDTLVKKSYVIAKANSAHVYSNVTLNVDKLADIYKYIGRQEKKDINNSIMEILANYKERNQILNLYCTSQNERMDSNKSIQFFNDDLVELENILLAVDELLKVDTETFVRDFSVKVFKDSKVFERIAGKVVNLIYEYGNFPEKDKVLGNLNIIKNPTYVNFKGPGSISIKEQKLDLTNFRGDLAVSSIMLSDIDNIDITGKAVITIENLTSFHTFSDKEMFAIYLGGYHNSVRRDFIRKSYQQNPHKAFYHFGDIDAGGFNILEHLKRETGVEFIPFKMDIETLENYTNYTKKLTENDKKRLLRLLDSKHSDVIKYMLDNNCKLEQEAIDIV